MRLASCLCPAKAKREDPEGDDIALSGHGAEKSAESDELSSKAQGKQVVGRPVLSGRSSSGEGFLPSSAEAKPKNVTVKLRRTATDVPFGMTINGSRNRVTEVKLGSPAEAGGVRLFDVVLKIDGAALGDQRLSVRLQRKLSPKLLLERPEQSSYARIAAGEMHSGDDEWAAAVTACACGDRAALGAYLQGAAWRGEAEAVLSRRVTSSEVGAIALRTMAEGGVAVHVPSESLLVEISIEAGHHDLVELLLCNTMCSATSMGNTPLEGAEAEADAEAEAAAMRAFASVGGPT